MRFKWTWSGLIVLVLLLIIPAGKAEALLVVFSPQETIEQADLIIAGTVMERSYQDDERRVTIAIEQVLKGSSEEKFLRLEYKKSVIYGWTGFDFPEPGVKILLLLKGSKEEGYWPAGELNYVAVIREDQVQELYHGSVIGHNTMTWMPQDYAQAYAAFYQSCRAAEGIFSITVVNLDDDMEQEIVAHIDGGVHLGQFLVFDKDFQGNYKLITEQDWKLERWDPDHPLSIDGKKVFQVITRDGGTGVDSLTVHLFYLHQNEFIEAWQHTILERSVFAGQCWQKVSGHQIDLYYNNKRLYTWETAFHYRLAADGITPEGGIKVEKTTRVYVFNGTKFVQAGLN